MEPEAFPFSGWISTFLMWMRLASQLASQSMPFKQSTDPFAIRAGEIFNVS